MRNQALYYLRQSFFNGKLMSGVCADKCLKLHHSQLYNSLPAAMSQAIIKQLGDDFSSFFNAIAAYGIEVIETEESYTSKADSLALDSLPVYQQGIKPPFSGRRKKRGLYQSSNGKLLHADVNGAINILRKVIGDGFVKSLVDRDCVFQPMQWQPR